jgi:hypothetical protein
MYLLVFLILESSAFAKSVYSFAYLIIFFRPATIPFSFWVGEVVRHI